MTNNQVVEGRPSDRRQVGWVRCGLSGAAQAGEILVLDTAFAHSVHGVSAVPESGALAVCLRGRLALGGWVGVRRQAFTQTVI